MEQLAECRELSRIFLAYLAANYTMQQIIDNIYARTEMPMMVLDINNRVILHTQCPSAGRIWDFAVGRGYMPNAIFAQQQRDPESKLCLMYQTGNIALYEPGEIDDCFLACMPLINSEIPEGILIVRFGDRADFDFAAALAEKSAELFQYFSYSGSADSNHKADFLKTAFARELLLYDSGENSSLFSEAYQIKLEGSGEVSSHFRPGYFIAAIRTLDSGDTTGELSLAESELPSFIPKSFCVISEQTLLVMFFDLADNALEKKNDSGILMQLDIFSRRYHLYCGISSEFCNLSQRKNYKRQAIAALSLGSRKNPAGYIFKADDLYVEIVLSEAVNRVGKKILELSDVKILAEYDVENKTNYLQTLKHYLNSNNNTAIAAASMYVDRGTIKYRLQKIKNILRDDFDQPEYAKLLRLGIEIYEGIL